MNPQEALHVRIAKLTNRGLDRTKVSDSSTQRSVPAAARRRVSRPSIGLKPRSSMSSENCRSRRLRGDWADGRHGEGVKVHDCQLVVAVRPVESNRHEHLAAERVDGEAIDVEVEKGSAAVNCASRLVGACQLVLVRSHSVCVAESTRSASIAVAPRGTADELVGRRIEVPAIQRVAIRPKTQHASPGAAASAGGADGTAIVAASANDSAIVRKSACPCAARMISSWSYPRVVPLWPLPRPVAERSARNGM